MKKTILTMTGAAFVCAATVTTTPTPAAAFAPLFFVPVMMAKYDPNFKAVNPYEKKVVKTKRKTKKM